MCLQELRKDLALEVVLESLLLHVFHEVGKGSSLYVLLIGIPNNFDPFENINEDIFYCEGIRPLLFNMMLFKIL